MSRKQMEGLYTTRELSRKNIESESSALRKGKEDSNSEAVAPATQFINSKPYLDLDLALGFGFCLRFLREGLSTETVICAEETDKDLPESEPSLASAFSLVCTGTGPLMGWP